MSFESLADVKEKMMVLDNLSEQLVKILSKQSSQIDVQEALIRELMKEVNIFHEAIFGRGLHDVDEFTQTGGAMFFNRGL